MAALQPLDLEDKLSCAICLDIFTDPVTTPCGHNFCMRCLQGHLDSQSSAGPFDCPTCRTHFVQRPEGLCKNLVLDEMVRFLRLRVSEPPQPEVEHSGCQLHHKPLDLYCREDRLCICSVCATREHKGHDLVTVEDERLQRENELVAKHEEMERQVKKTVGLIDTLKQQKISIKFPQEIHPLNKSQQDIVLPASDLAIEHKLGGVKRALEEIAILICKNLQGFFRQVPQALDIPDSTATDRCVPAKPLEPRPLPASLHVREPFLQSYRQLSFNPNTVHRFLTLSKDNHRVSHKATQRYPTHAERFEKEWQVLCCESFDTGQHYWEVQISSQWAYLGVAYKKISRHDDSSLIGRNNVSWSLQLFSKSYSAWHAGEEVKLQPANYGWIGVHLDCTAGTLAFYGITDTMTLIHVFHSVFTEPLYPAVWVGENVVATLRRFQ
ncbi:E3 ubiquitin-protein ligase TRIM65 isoform X2 [Heterodontus francisci]|uniref:E3 ubiquitin-protein ligase TRIM65 isoform X2 n=1 Tax=Heterodontus francisci TaxID=7792 RepID=UPI00355BAE79